MTPLSTSICTRGLVASAAIILVLSASQGNCFQINNNPVICARPPKLASPSSHHVKMSLSSSSFQQARLAEQLRLSNNNQSTGESEEMVASVSEGGTEMENGDEVEVSVSTATVDASSEEAQNLLALERSSDALGSDGMPFAPMMTYQKYLTMQEKRVKVTIRYSAEAGLRPFYLTVANQIKSTHPDVLLEKRILPPVGSDAGGDEAIFEVVVDGKKVVGKKETKLLKVSQRGGSTRGGEESKDEHDGKIGEGSGSNAKKSGGSGDTNTPDIAGGRSIFVSMEKLDHEMNKARKRRRPNTMYKSKEDAVSSTAGDGMGTVPGQFNAEGGQTQNNVNVMRSAGMTEAVMRLERLKAMSTRNKI